MREKKKTKMIPKMCGDQLGGRFSSWEAFSSVRSHRSGLSSPRLYPTSDRCCPEVPLVECQATSSEFREMDFLGC